MVTDLRILNAATLSELMRTEFFKSNITTYIVFGHRITIQKEKLCEIKNLINIKPFTMGTDLSILNVASSLRLMLTKK